MALLLLLISLTSYPELINVDVDKKKIALKNSLHKVGSYEVDVVFAKDAVAKVTVIIEGESDIAK